MYVVKAYKNEVWNGYVAYDLQQVIDIELDPELNAVFLYEEEQEALLVADFASNKKKREEAAIRDWRFDVEKAEKHERKEIYYK